MAAKLDYDGSQESKEGIFAILDDWREQGHFNMFEAPRQLIRYKCLGLSIDTSLSPFGPLANPILLVVNLL